jgi:hypothetical protein
MENIVRILNDQKGLSTWCWCLKSFNSSDSVNEFFYNFVEFLILGAPVFPLFLDDLRAVKLNLLDSPLKLGEALILFQTGLS